MSHDDRRSTLPPPRPRPEGYWECAQRPWPSLILLLPLIVCYELGTLLYATDHASGITHYIYARSLLRDFFDLIGVTGYYLPGLIVVVVLLCWHIARQDPWRIRPRLCVGMAVESIALAAPPFVFMVMLAQQQSGLFETAPAMLAAIGDSVGNAGGNVGGGVGGWQAKLVFSIGAGIYEELLFRLILIALLHLVLVDILTVPSKLGAGIAIGLSSVAFALYHFSEVNQFSLGLFLVYTGAGLYLAAVYVLRGFGIVATTHAMYDVFVVLLQVSQSGYQG